MTRLVLYTRQGCHLCEDAERLIRSLADEFDLIDVDSDAELQARYGDQVPVLEINGRIIGAGIIGEKAVREELRAEDGWRFRRGQ
jgi:glutaredoxin